MAKNNYRMNVNQYANQEDNIRKAKGNPNKNIHHKKKNSNYGGYTAGSYMAQRIMDKANQQERVKLPTWLKVWLGVLFAAVIVVLILRLTVYKDSILLNSLSSLLLGITCLSLFYIRRFKHTKKDSGLYKAVTVILTLCGVIYTFMGVVGLSSPAPTCLCPSRDWPAPAAMTGAPPWEPCSRRCPRRRASLSAA